MDPSPAASAAAPGAEDGSFVVGYRRRVTRRDYLALTGPLGFGDDQDAPAAHPTELTDVLLEWQLDVQEHLTCPAWCEECDQWERPRSCVPCEGSGCSPATALGAYDPCPHCAGDGRDHQPYTPTGTWQHQPVTPSQP